MTERGGWWKWWQIEAMIAKAIRQHSMRADLANERAERWKRRCDEARRERDELREAFDD